MHHMSPPYAVKLFTWKKVGFFRGENRILCHPVKVSDGDGVPDLTHLQTVIILVIVVKQLVTLITRRC